MHFENENTIAVFLQTKGDNGTYDGGNLTDNNFLTASEGVANRSGSNYTQNEIFWVCRFDHKVIVDSIKLLY